MKYTIGSYHIEKYDDGNLKIDYKRSPKDYFNVIVYFLISVPFLYFGYKLITFLEGYEINSNTIIGFLFSICLLLFGLYFLFISLDTLNKPINNVFFINSSKKQLIIKLNLFKKFNLILVI